MSLMYEVNALNAAMIKAAEVCRQDMPEGDKVNAVLACFAGMKPVEAEPVVYAVWVRCGGKTNLWYCSGCGGKIMYNPNRRVYSIKKLPVELMHKRCRSCGAHMRGDAADAP